MAVAFCFVVSFGSVLAFTGGVDVGDLLQAGGQLIPAALSPSCRIKGNISYVRGEHIYHVPGQEHYDETVINLKAGERWFCSEDEARAAGWRPARR
jgi:hypothetical protein